MQTILCSSRVRALLLKGKQSPAYGDRTRRREVALQLSVGRHVDLFFCRYEILCYSFFSFRF